MRVSNEFVDELIQNEGKMSSGHVNQMGILRLALDLRDARETLRANTKPRKTVTVGAATPAWRWLTERGFFPLHRRSLGRKVFANFVLDYETHEEFLQTSL